MQLNGKRELCAFIFFFSPSIRQPSSKMADRTKGLTAKHSKKVSGSTTTRQLSMRICVYSAQQRFWFARFKVQRETQSSHCAVYRATHCIALRESRRIGTCKKSERLFVEFHKYCSSALCLICPTAKKNMRLFVEFLNTDGPIARWNIKHDVYLCALFVYQSSPLEHPRRGRVKNSDDLMDSV